MSKPIDFTQYFRDIHHRFTTSPDFLKPRKWCISLNHDTVKRQPSNHIPQWSTLILLTNRSSETKKISEFDISLPFLFCVSKTANDNRRKSASSYWLERGNRQAYRDNLSFITSLLEHYKSTCTEHIVFVMILKNSGFGLGSTMMIQPIYASLQFSTTKIDQNSQLQIMVYNQKKATTLRIMALRLKTWIRFDDREILIVQLVNLYMVRAACRDNIILNILYS